MALKACGNCGELKPLTLFSWKNQRLGLRHSICKQCHFQYRQKHYLANRSVYIAKARKWNSDQKVKLQKAVLKYLSGHSCVDCGEADILVLDFDHKASKTKGISEMVKSCCSIERLMVEIGKCEVRCANCHRRKTFKELSYWKTGA